MTSTTVFSSAAMADRRVATSEALTNVPVCNRRHPDGYRVELIEKPSR
jgi:hypothetical protein